MATNSYTKQTWEDAPSTNSPISAERLNHMETGIKDNNTGVRALETAVGNVQNLSTSSKEAVGAINEINQHLSKHTADNGTVIYNGIGTVPSQYVCPSDGYIWANLESNVYARFRINSKMPTNFYHVSGGLSTAAPVYVRKGTIIDDIAINSNSGSSILYFFALE